MAGRAGGWMGAGGLTLCLISSISVGRTGETQRRARLTGKREARGGLSWGGPGTPTYTLGRAFPSPLTGQPLPTMFFNEEAMAKRVSENQRPPLVLGVIPADLRPPSNPGFALISSFAPLFLKPHYVPGEASKVKLRTAGTCSIGPTIHWERCPNTDRAGEGSQWIISQRLLGNGLDTPILQTRRLRLSQRSRGQ